METCENVLLHVTVYIYKLIGEALHNCPSFSCGPLERLIAHPWSRGLRGRDNWESLNLGPDVC